MENKEKIFNAQHPLSNVNARSITYRSGGKSPKSPRRVDEENKTDEELGDALGISHRCDECDEMMKFETWVERQDAILECGHGYCKKCIPNIKKDAHTLTKCPVVAVKCRIPNWYQTGQAAKPSHRKSEAARKEYSTKAKLWNFEYKGRPLVVSLRRDATYGDLETSLSMLLNIDLKTNMILIHLPHSYNGADVNYFMKADDSLTNGPYEKDTKLSHLRHPKIAALSLEVTEKKTPSSETPSKENPKSPGPLDSNK